MKTYNWSANVKVQHSMLCAAVAIKANGPMLAMKHLQQATLAAREETGDSLLAIAVDGGRCKFTTGVKGEIDRTEWIDLAGAVIPPYLRGSVRRLKGKVS